MLLMFPVSKSKAHMRVENSKGNTSAMREGKAKRWLQPTQQWPLFQANTGKWRNSNSVEFQNQSKIYARVRKIT